MSLGKNIYELRKREGFSQEELAQRCHVSRQTISRWEANEVMPDTNNLLELSKLFQISIDELINNENVPFKKELDIFDRIIDLIKTHWAKMGYFLSGGGILFIVWGFIIKGFMKMTTAGFPDASDEFNAPFLLHPSLTINSFTNIPIIIGGIMLVIGVGFIVKDYRKNHSVK